MSYAIAAWFSGFGVGISVAILACSASTPPPVAKLDEVAMFSAALKTCVDNNNTRETIDACRSAVEFTYCGPNGPLASSAGCARDGGR